MPSIRVVLDRIRSRLPEVNFITLHYTFFITTALLASLIFWASSTPLNSVSYTDSLFLSVSAVTVTGLNTVNLSQLNTWQQVMLFILPIIGSPITISCAIVYIRLNAFEKAFVEYKLERQAKSRQNSDWWRKKLSRARSLAEVAADEKQQGHSTSTGDVDATERTDFAPGGAVSTANRTRYPDDSSSTSTNGGFEERGRNLDGSSSNRPQCPSLSPAGRASVHDGHVDTTVPAISFAPEPRFGLAPERFAGGGKAYTKSHQPLVSFSGVGAMSSTLKRRTDTSRSVDFPRKMSRTPSMQLYDQSKAERLTAHGWISRNSQLHGLTLEERRKLGGREYRAVVFLSFLIPIYLITWQALGAVSLGAYVRTYYADLVRANGQNPFWAGAFLSISAFSNDGMSLVDANMVAFQNSVFILISMSLIILAGNTAYPIFLRGAIWTMWKILPDSQSWNETKQTCRFLLDHPRRVYTNLFPSEHTWWLGLSLIILNGLDWMFFEVLSIGDQDIESLSRTTRVLGGLFQAFCVRTGGFYVVPIPTLRISVQFLYIIMMYIAVYPVTITMRNSNVYEERSLGIFAEDLVHEQCGEQDAPVSTQANEAGPANFKRRMTTFLENAVPAPRREKRSYFMRQQLRSQLAHDVWFAVLAVFLILIIETNQLEANPVNFSALNVIFEVVSAYSGVGISVGVAYDAFSFCGSWHILSKLILCAVMLRGRHRVLPVAIDHAIQLPGRQMWDAEDEDGERRMEKLELWMSRADRNRFDPDASPVT